MRDEWQLMLANELYLANDQTLVELRQRARRLMHRYNHSSPDETNLRNEILKELLDQELSNVFIEPPFHVDYGKNITLGANVYMNFGCVLLDCNTIRIGDNVMFAPYVQVLTAYHPIDAETRNSGQELAAAIEIGNSVWIGGGAIICPGVKIGDNTVIGAGSVVTKDIPANVVAVGNPCRVLRSVDSGNKPKH